MSDPGTLVHTWSPPLPTPAAAGGLYKTKSAKFENGFEKNAKFIKYFQKNAKFENGFEKSAKFIFRKNAKSENGFEKSAKFIKYFQKSAK